MTSTEAPPAIIDNKGYDEALKALGGLISGKKRPNGSSWSHAFESMRVHLDVWLRGVLRNYVLR